MELEIWSEQIKRELVFENWVSYSKRIITRLGSINIRFRGIQSLRCLCYILHVLLVGWTLEVGMVEMPSLEYILPLLTSALLTRNFSMQVTSSQQVSRVCDKLMGIKRLDSLTSIQDQSAGLPNLRMCTWPASSSTHSLPSLLPCWYSIWDLSPINLPMALRTRISFQSAYCHIYPQVKIQTKPGVCDSAGKVL